MKRLALASLLLLLTACSNKPDEALITQQLTQQLLQRHSDAIFEVVNVKRLNGISRNRQTYDAEVAYDLRFLVDLEDATAQLQRKSGSIFAAGLETTALGLSYGNFRKGDTLHQQEWIRFVHSEKGWMIDQVKR